MKWVEDYTGFSDVPAEQQGNYFAITINSDVEGITLTNDFGGDTLVVGNTIVFRFTDRVEEICFTATKEGYSESRLTINTSELSLKDTSEITIEGTLPLTFTGDEESSLSNYIVYGAENGSGTETRNIFDPSAKDASNGFVANARLRKDGTVQNYTGSNITEYIPIKPGTNYYIWPGATLNLFGNEIYDENKVRTRGTEYESREYLGFTARAGEAYVRFTYWAANDEKVALYEGTNSTVYIPHGYQIPLTLTSSDQSQNYNLYIGDSKLGEDEYISYKKQKIYKMSEGTLAPVDPPVALPTLTIAEGENTLSSTETLGKVSITGYIINPLTKTLLREDLNLKEEVKEEIKEEVKEEN